jgi:hypothetical protein
MTELEDRLRRVLGEAASQLEVEGPHTWRGAAAPSGLFAGALGRWAPRPGTIVAAAGAALAVAVAVVALVAGSAHKAAAPAGEKPLPSLRVLPPRAPQLLGDGVGQARFGQRFAHVRLALRTELGTPIRTGSEPGMCGLDKTDLVWRRLGPTFAELVLYFRRARFAGYSYSAGSGGRGKPLHGLSTQKGLKLGDTMARGRMLYGKAFHTSTAQGGSWSVKVPGGKLIGYAVPPTGQPVTGPRSRVASIDAGNVGCPAMTP